MNSDTQISPGIGPLPSSIAALGGCIIDVVGVSGYRVTEEIAAATMFKGWVSGIGSAPDPTKIWLVVGTKSVSGSSLAGLLGGGITKANIRITLYDGDSGSPNPVYTAMFGSGAFPYERWTTQPGNYDFDGGTNLWIGFEDAAGNPVNCGYMGTTTTYRLGPEPDFATIESFTGFPGCFALTDPAYAGVTHPPGYMLPVQVGSADGIWPVTGWFAVPAGSLDELYGAIASGTIRIGVHDISPGDQYYDFTLGLPVDVVVPVVNTTLDLWVWRELHRFDSLDQDITFPPGYEKALMYALGAEFFPEYPNAAQKYDFAEFEADAAGALADLETLHASNAVAQEPAV